MCLRFFYESNGSLVEAAVVLPGPMVPPLDLSTPTVQEIYLIALSLQPASKKGGTVAEQKRRSEKVANHSEKM